MGRLRFVVAKGSHHLRQHLVMSCLSGRAVHVQDVRPLQSDPGLQDFELRFLKLLQEISKGCKVEIGETGTEVHFVPGMLEGGEVTFDCGLEKSIAYYLEAIIWLSPFVQSPLRMTLRGITNDLHDQWVDSIKSDWLPVIGRFYSDGQSAEIKVSKRGLPPNGGGEAYFSAPTAKQLRAVQFLKQGKIKRIRGTAFACKVSPLMATRQIEGAKSLLSTYLSDVYIYSDHRKGESGGQSPGFGIHLVAETMEGVFYSGSAMSNPGGEEPVAPEDVGLRAAKSLLDEVYSGGCVPRTAQPLAFLFMALCPKDVSKIITGKLTDFSVEFLRSIKEYFNVKFNIAEVKNPSDQLLGDSKLEIVGVGCGYGNLNRALT